MSRLIEAAAREWRDPDYLGGGGLDASLLCLPLRRVIPAGHPKMEVISVWFE